MYVGNPRLSWRLALVAVFLIAATAVLRLGFAAPATSAGAEKSAGGPATSESPLQDNSAPAGEPGDAPAAAPPGAHPIDASLAIARRVQAHLE